MTVLHQHQPPAKYSTTAAEDQFGSIKWDGPNLTEITPSWIGGHGSFRIGTDDAGQKIVKREYPAHIERYADRRAIGMAMDAAGRHSIGPKTFFSSDDEVLSEWLPTPWRRARLNDLLDPALRTAVIGLHLKFQSTWLPELPVRDVVNDVFLLREACTAEGIVVPSAVDDLLKTLGPFFQHYNSFARTAVPCHSDGAASNILFCSPTEVLLTGWTFAARRDPMQEAGSLLAELSPFCISAEDLVAQLFMGAENRGEPAADQDLVQMVRCLAVCDGLQWALVGYLNSGVAADKSIDYFKYGSWRLVNARSMLQSPELREWIGAL
jgi:hypothetical protein